MTTFANLDFDRCYRAVETRDQRFDGWFITGVTSTGIYCRPSCPTPIRPKAKNVEFYPTAAAAQLAGFRACKRCRPDASPGSPEWDLRADLVGRAMRLIADGVVDREGVAGLAHHLAVSERNLGRLFRREVGATPIAVARAQRAQSARVLIETTDLRFTDVAFAAGFASIRQFNDTVREVFAKSPTELRKAGSGSTNSGAIGLRLAIRAPLNSDALFGWVAGHAPNGLATVTNGVLTRTLRLPNGHAVASLTPQADHVWCEIQLESFADLSVGVARLRRLLDLDADPTSIAEHFAGSALADLVAADPGLRVPGAVDGFEQAVQTILGQQVSVSAGQTFGSRLVGEFGEPLLIPHELVDRVFPTAETLADADLSAIGLTGARQKTLTNLARAVAADGLDLSPGADRAATREHLLALAGVGPWTADMIAMRALGDPDVFPVGDLVLRKAAERLGFSADRKELAAQSLDWSPWRSYASHHLWATMYPESSD